ncbi:MAG: hypothetical protein IJJ33_09855, partial [Victivallales bacterium]|nr:hypothetical protein [Victivallales bacterium]
MPHSPLDDEIIADAYQQSRSGCIQSSLLPPLLPSSKKNSSHHGNLQFFPFSEKIANCQPWTSVKAGPSRIKAVGV